MFVNQYNSLAWIRGIEKGNVSIGEGSWIGPFCVIDGEYDKVSIGKGVNISSGAQIITHDTAKRCVSERSYNKIDHAPTTLEDFVYIGTNAVVLKGSVIGHHSIVAAGAIIKENSIIPPYSLVAGIPAVVKKNFEHEIKNWEVNNDTI